MVRTPKQGRILLLAMAGLTVSAFALVVLLSVMGGLQRNLMARSKSILGTGVYVFHEAVERERALQLMETAARYRFVAVGAYELELLTKHSANLAGAVVHALDPEGERPLFLKGLALEDVAVPLGLSLKLGLGRGEHLLLISPSHLDSFIEDIPRSVSGKVSDIFTTRVPELDEAHLWVRGGLIHNLIREQTLNTLRFYGSGDWPGLARAVAQGPYGELGRLFTWEQRHATLVWALRLESNVMALLFTATALLVSLCVTSGLMIFFDKMKNDLTGLWILGAGERALHRAWSLFIVLMSLSSSLLGLALGLLFLFLLDRYAPEILPQFFVDRKIPVAVNLRGCLTAFLIPFGISLIFGQISLGYFRRQSEGHLEQLRNSPL